MPPSSSRDACVFVSVSVSPDRSRAVVRLGGDLDMEARPALDDVVHHLAVVGPDSIDVDVSAVSYVGSVLPNFLVQIRKAAPAGSVLTVSHPSPLTQFVLRVTDMAEIASIEHAVSAGPGQGK